MEQYELTKETTFDNLRKVLSKYKPLFLFIRDCGGIREDGNYSPCGRRKVYEELDDKNFDFVFDESGFHVLVDNEEVFHFTLKLFWTGCSIGYERRDEDGIYFYPPHTDWPFKPDNLYYPQVKCSIFRGVIDNQLIEITFDGKIELEPFESPSGSDVNEHTKYWQVK